MKTILGTGQLGLTIMQLLLEKNPDEKILMVNRTGKLKIPIPQNVEVTAADTTSKTAMAAIASRSDLIFSCTDMPYDQWAAFYPATANALAYALSETNAKLGRSTGSIATFVKIKISFFIGLIWSLFPKKKIKIFGLIFIFP